MSLARSFTFAELGIDPDPPGRIKTRQEELQEGLERVAKGLGIDVAYYPFRSPRIAGLLIHEDDGRYCIGINSRMIPTRQLFSLAHELGHYSLHRHLQETFLCHTGRQDKLEREANAYAVKLLMPEHTVRELVAKGWGLRAMCEYFGVSRAAMEWRLRECEVQTITSRFAQE